MCIHPRSHHQHASERGGTTTTVPAGDVRVSSAERDAVVDQLKRHTADGRLTLDELSDRVEQALAATNGDELRLALRELPPVGTGDRVGGARRGPRSHAFLPTALIVALVLAAIATGHPWVLFPLGWFVFARFGPRRWPQGSATTAR